MTTCSFRGCGADVRAKTFCSGHLYQFNSGRQLTPIDRAPKPKVCTVEGCTTKVQAKGWCQKHYMRVRETGTTELLPRVYPDRTKLECSVPGCSRPQWTGGLCGLHDKRMRNDGAVGPVTVTVAPKGSGSTRADGYRVVYAPGHPLAYDSGQILEHRKVLYAKIGPGTHPCHWCGIPLEWGGISGINADHVDFDRSNNQPSNLVAACSECNKTR